jgi:hypothetical protein
MDEHERSTRTKRILLAAVTFLLLSGPLSAHANLIWDWRGDCDGIIIEFPIRGGSSGCTGQAAMLVVTTDAYIPGELFLPAATPVLLHALYADENVTSDLAPPFNRNGIFFQLPASPSEGGFIQAEAHGFRSDANGVWRFGGEGLRPGCDLGIDNLCAYDARGFNGVWTRVPAPSTLVLLGVGLAGLIFSRRRWASLRVSSSGVSSP